MSSLKITGLAASLADHPNIRIKQGAGSATLPPPNPCGAIVNPVSTAGPGSYTATISWNGIESGAAVSDIEMEFTGSSVWKPMKKEWTITAPTANSREIFFASPERRKFRLRAVSDNGTPGPWSDALMVESTLGVPTVKPGKTPEPLLLAQGLKVQFAILSDTLDRGESARCELASDSPNPVPPGLSLSDRGNLTGTPAIGSAGVHDLKLRWFNTAGEVFLDYRIEILPSPADLPRNVTLKIDRSALVMPSPVSVSVECDGWGVGNRIAHRHHIGGQTRWDMGAPGQTHLDVDGRLAAYGLADANTAFGPEVVHTYHATQVTPGTKTITAVVSDGLVTKTVTTTVECIHPDDYFDETNTVYASTSGDFPAGAVHTYTGTSIRAAHRVITGDRRIRFHDDESFDDGERLFEETDEGGVVALIDRYDTGTPGERPSLYKVQIGGNRTRRYTQVSVRGIRTPKTYDAVTGVVTDEGKSGLNVNRGASGPICFSECVSAGANTTLGSNQFGPEKIGYVLAVHNCRIGVDGWLHYGVYGGAYRTGLQGTAIIYPPTGFYRNYDSIGGALFRYEFAGAAYGGRGDGDPVGSTCCVRGCDFSFHYAGKFVGVQPLYKLNGEAMEYPGVRVALDGNVMEGSNFSMQGVGSDPAGIADTVLNRTVWIGSPPRGAGLGSFKQGATTLWNTLCITPNLPAATVNWDGSPLKSNVTHTYFNYTLADIGPGNQNEVYVAPGTAAEAVIGGGDTTTENVRDGFFHAFGTTIVNWSDTIAGVELTDLSPGRLDEGWPSMRLEGAAVHAPLLKTPEIVPGLDLSVPGAVSRFGGYRTPEAPALRDEYVIGATFTAGGLTDQVQFPVPRATAAIAPEGDETLPLYDLYGTRRGTRTKGALDVGSGPG